MADARIAAEPHMVDMSAEIHALVIAREDGTVLAQNAPARRLMGAGLGRPCWDVVGGITGAEGLPCAPGGARRLLARRPARSAEHCVSLMGERYHLACVPMNDFIVCLLSPGADAPPQARRLLTSREREVLRLLAEGENTTSVSARLGLSESTVRTHVEHMRCKLGASTRAQLVALGFRLGYLD
jgi:DNA-binding CsgD family transcriptional regulator